MTSLSLSSFSSSAALYTITPVIQRLLGFLTIPIMTSVLPPSEYGVNLIILNTLNIITFLVNLGLDSAFMVYFCSSEEREEKKAMFSSVLIFRLIIFTPLLAFSILFANQIKNSLIPEYSYSYIVYIALLAHLIFIVNQHFALVLRAINQHKKRVVLELVSSVLQAAIAVALVLTTKLGLISIYAGNLVSQLCVLPLFYKYTDSFIALLFDKSILKKMLEFGLPLMPNSISVLIILHTTGYYISGFYDIKVTGLYSVAISIASIITFVTVGFNQVWSPFVYSNYKDIASNLIFIDIHRIYSSLLLILGVFISLFSFEIVSFLVSDIYIDCWIYIPPIVMALIVYALADYFDIGIGIMKKSKYRLYCAFVSLSIFLMMVWPLLSLLGPIGFAVAQTVAFIGMGFFLGYYSYKLYPCDFLWSNVIFMYVIIISIVGVFLYSDYFSSYNNVHHKFLVLIFCLLVPFFTKCLNKKDIERFGRINIKWIKA